VHGVPAGSVNSNFFLDTARGRVFARIYEEQEVDGVEYEWALLDHLAAAGLPVPRRVEGPAPGEVRVSGKPTALFEVLGGEEICQAMVDEAHAEAVGRLVARAHRAAADFSRRRAGRFTLADVRRRLEGVRALDRPELREAVGRLFETLDEVEAAWDPSLPSGVIHGDLFRDNVRWEGHRIVGALDWESASDGLYVYDLAVTLLAWCYGDALDWRLARALTRGYERARPLEPAERAFLRTALSAAAARFTVTRITDYHLREGQAQVKKDWRRFEARLRAVRALDAATLADRLA
jgi:homoserine kinase type II